jgi:hypothetical protein
LVSQKMMVQPATKLYLINNLIWLTQLTCLKKLDHKQQSLGKNLRLSSNKFLHQLKCLAKSKTPRKTPSQCSLLVLRLRNSKTWKRWKRKRKTRWLSKKEWNPRDLLASLTLVQSYNPTKISTNFSLMRKMMRLETKQRLPTLTKLLKW